MFLEMYFSWPFVVFFLFFCELLSFVATIFLLPRSFSFSRELFSFAATAFLLQRAFFFYMTFLHFAANIFFFFALEISLLSWPISFCREHFYFAGTFFCRDQFLFFSASIFVLPREFFFCRELFSFVLTPVDHCITILNLLPFKKTNLYYHLRKYISLFYQISPNSISIQTISQRLFLLHLLLKRKKTAAENSIMLNKLLT